MFDIGFVEILLIAVVGLLVIGPERLPETVRTLGLWIGRFKRSLRDTRSELERQLGADDIRRELHNETIMRNLDATRRDLEKAVTEGGRDDPPALPKQSRTTDDDKASPGKAPLKDSHPKTP